jgi:hypothetical protein
MAGWLIWLIISSEQEVKTKKGKRSWEHSDRLRDRSMNVIRINFNWIMHMYEHLNMKKSKCEKITNGKQSQLMILLSAGSPSLGRNKEAVLYNCT